MNPLSSSNRPAVSFWPHTFSQRIASARLRCFKVVEQLSAEGVDARLYAPGQPAPQVLVLSKRYDRTSISHAARLRDEQGVRLIVDLCDNHFHHPPREPFVRRAADLRQALAVADTVVLGSAALAEEIVRHCPSVRDMRVVGDMVEHRLPAGAGWRESARSAWQGLRLQQFFKRFPVAAGRRLIWFGNHGVQPDEGGMHDLMLLHQALHAHHAQQPLSLTLVSNAPQAGGPLFADWRLPVAHLPWSASNFDRVLGRHDIALIPVRINAFTRCKTSNRVASALDHGLAVAASPVPSYALFSSALVLDDWTLGLGRLMSDAPWRAQTVQAGRALVGQWCSPQRLAEEWRQVVTQAGPARPPF